MTPFMTLFWLGLGVSTMTQAQAATIPTPNLWAEPGFLVPWGSPVTLWCQGTLGAKKFQLDKTGSSSTRDMELQLEPGDKAKFTVFYMTESDTVTYHCSYLSSTGWSEYSNPLQLVVTDFYSNKPSLSAFPSPVVASGETVTLQCSSERGFDTFVLTQEGDSESPWKLGSQQIPSGQRQALFYVAPGPLHQNWSIRCYGLFSGTPHRWSPPSNPLQLLVSGVSRRPSLLKPQGQIVTPGQTLTLQCCSKDAYDTFALYKEKSQDVRQHPGHQPQAGLSKADISLGPVSASHGGQYRCFGRHNFTSLWSEPSDPIDILVAEQLSYTPTLSVEPGPKVSPGDNVTLLCRSSDLSNIFLLAKEGTADPPLHVKLDKIGKRTKVEFSFHPVTSAHNGTYRCYSSTSFNPYWLSHPSVPIQLLVSGPSGNSGAMPMADVQPLLIGLSTAGTLLGLFLLLFLLLFLRHRRQAGHHTSGATHPAPQDTGLNNRSRLSAHIQKDSPDTITHTQSEEGARLNPQTKQDEDPHGATYAQVKHAGRRWGVASGTPLSGARLNAQDQQTEENTQAGGQAEAPDTHLEVTYAQLKHLDTAQENTAPPATLSGEPPEEPSVYAALAFH